MTQILNKTEKEPKPKKMFSKLSFAMAFITIIVMLYFANKALESFKPVDPRIGEKIKRAEILTTLSCIIGIVFTLISITVNEPSSFFKWTGGILNTLLILLWGIALLYMYP